MHAVAENEDPTTQIPWPSRQRLEQPNTEPADSQSNVALERESAVPTTPVKKRLSSWNLITLSVLRPSSRRYCFKFVRHIYGRRSNCLDRRTGIWHSFSSFLRVSFPN